MGAVLVAGMRQIDEMEVAHPCVNAMIAAAAPNAQAATVNITSFTSLWELSILPLSSSRTCARDRASAHGSSEASHRFSHGQHALLIRFIRLINA